MPISIDVSLSYAVSQPSDLLFQIEAATTGNQQPRGAALTHTFDHPLCRIAGEEDIGERFWVHVESGFECRYRAEVDVTRPQPDLHSLAQSPLTSLDGNTVKYLMASRYCPLSPMDALIAAEFSNLTGGAFVSAASEWLQRNLTYDNGVSTERTTAAETLRDRRGVCRDYAHVLIALARSVAIPARIVSVYAPDVDPPDFHAVAEVYLDDAWHLVDPTGMATADSMVRIGVGRDAVDVSFLTSYGFLDLRNQTVDVKRIP